MAGGWDQALDAMTDLNHAFKTEEYQKYLTGFASSMAGRGKTFNRDTMEVDDTPADAAGQAHIRGLVQTAMSTVNEGEPVWVSPDVCDLIDYAAEAPTFKLTPVWLDELFVPNAFVLLGQKMVQPDVRGLEFSYRAVSWRVVSTYGHENQAESGVVLCKWSHKNDGDDYWNPETGILSMADGESIEVKKRLLGGSALTLSHVGYIPFGNEAILQEPINARMIAMFEAMWRLAQQYVVLSGPERTSRPVWKRAATWKQIKEVTVLKLRRARPPTKYEGERDVEWSHRWMVSGHWRNQPYKVNGQTEYKQIWIESYVKGPEDKPLVVKRHAVEFTR